MSQVALSGGAPASGWLRARDLAEALVARAAGDRVVLAGGTDFYAARADRAIESAVLDISGLGQLRGVLATADPQGQPVWRIGALTTWTDLVRGQLDGGLHSLQQAAAQIGGIQVQNRGTVGGNLCNASPAADSAVPLLALDAQVELASVRGLRQLPLSEFLRGPRRTALADDELLTAVLLPRWSAAAWSAFDKLGHRRYLVISIAMAALALDVDQDGVIVRCGLAVGACGPTAARLPALEAALRGATVNDARGLAARVAAVDPAQAWQPLAPIDDVRGTAIYRRAAVKQLVGRLLVRAADEHRGRQP